ncbi:hypothetical protein OHPBIL_OHPBIL_11975, partial [Dysosmobacter welbionis]
SGPGRPEGAAGGLAGQYGPPGPLRLHPAVRGAGGAGAGHQLCEICGQRSESGWPVGAGGA